MQAAAVWTTLLATAIALAGCSQIIAPAPSTTLEFACAMLSGQGRIVVEAWVEGDVGLEMDPVLALLRPALAEASGRLASGVHVDPVRALPRTAQHGEGLAEWAASRSFAERGDTVLRVAVVDRLDDPDRAGFVVAAGVVALSEAAVLAAASRTGSSETDLAVAAILHQVGHAMGAVNLGIPVQDPALQEREGPAHHDPDPDSVLHAAWDDARTMPASPPRGFAQHSLDDWAAARGPDGVCA